MLEVIRDDFSSSSFEKWEVLFDEMLSEVDRGVAGFFSDDSASPRHWQTIEEFDGIILIEIDLLNEDEDVNVKDYGVSIRPKTQSVNQVDVFCDGVILRSFLIRNNRSLTDVCYKPGSMLFEFLKDGGEVLEKRIWKTVRCLDDADRVTRDQDKRK